MGILTFVDVLLGLFFVYLVFAMVASAVNEAIAALLSSRARWLQSGLRRVLGPELSRVLRSPHLALMAQSGGRGGDRKGYRLSYLRASELLRALLLPMPGGHGGAAAPWDLAWVSQRVDQLDAQSPIRAVLEQLVQEADGSMDSFNEAFERWYGHFEATVRSWYRQRTHFVLMGISLGLAVLFNVDSIRIVQHLSTDAAARQQLAAMAVEATRSAQSAATPGQDEVQAARAALEQALAQPEEPGKQKAVLSAQARLEQALLDLRVEVTRQVEVLNAAGLPLGWRRAEFTHADAGFCQFMSDWFWAVLFALPGLLMSACAFTLGAPFWFDLLKQIANMRSVGRAPAEVSRAEAAGLGERSS